MRGHELAPCNWKQTREKPEAQQLIAENLWLTVLDAIDRSHEDDATRCLLKTIAAILPPCPSTSTIPAPKDQNQTVAS